MENNKEVNITYETLFEILRREKDKEELQKLSDSFFSDVIAYLEDKKKALSDATLQSFGDKKKLEDELGNIRRILKDLYERREKKIVNLALNISRTKSNLIDTSALLNEEKSLFDSLIRNLDYGRESILNNLLESKTPGFEQPKVEEPKTKDVQTDAAPKEEPKEEASKEENHKNTKMVRFTNAVPKFVGKELEEYGPFEEEDVANLPTEIANVLIEKGRVEEIKET
ncbi:hypothetical protein KY360_02090 [Candidatus Woesearchaeota archaeon]|nr:hypothetical protein [Candidatus Woesearchaeota archaeon]